jgi:glycine hydroxymethyltransferase
VVTSTTHKTLRGPRGGLILSKGHPDLEKKLNAAIFPGTQGGPLMHIIAAKAVAFKEALEPSFKVYAKHIIQNSKSMVSVMQKRGYKIVSNSTYNHLFLIDLLGKDFSGKEAETILGHANMTLNKNSVPNDPRSPHHTSGLRIGTPAVTTRGFTQADCEQVAHWIADILDDIHNTELVHKIKNKVIDLCTQYPVYK